MWAGALVAQGSPPWENPLLVATSTDGRIFSPPAMFQDSSGVPSVIRWRGDTLICAFQWFRQPMGSPSWDRVAVKFSYDAGQSWTDPVPIVVNGLPQGYQRPFDPTLVAIPGGDSLRIFFSSSAGLPMGLDSTVNTYSAVGTDGVHYTFEPGARYDHPTNQVIDPAVALFNGTWHYTAPAGAPQDGAYHCTASNGLNFSYVGQIASDAFHNWTGNLMLENPTEMRFYGSGSMIWYRGTGDGTVWQPYQTTNVMGGDPSVLKIASGSYLMVYVGSPGFVGHDVAQSLSWGVYPNPASDFLYIRGPAKEGLHCRLYSATGVCLKSCEVGSKEPLAVHDLEAGLYFLRMETGGMVRTLPWVKE